MENPSLDGLTDGFRYGSKFEELRHHVYQSVKSGKLKKLPEVQPLKVGNSAAMITARLNFGVNFLGCAGYKVLKETNSESLSETTAEMILICGSDDDYTGLNQSQIDEWRQKAQLVILAGNPPNADELKAMGIDAFIHVKSDVLETNKSILKMLTLV
jgi:methylmalonyl-CoA mutase